MHNYLRTIGFSKIKTKRQFDRIVSAIISMADDKKLVLGINDVIWAEYRKEFAAGIGIAVCGEYTEDDGFSYEFSYPYYNSMIVSMNADITIERQSDKDSFLAMCDLYKLGVNLIFSVQNRMDYLRYFMKTRSLPENIPISLTAMSTNGMIMLPLNKNEFQEENARRDFLKRNMLFERAKAGDEDAMETLTRDDINRNERVSEKILTNDLYTLVDTSFMPYGTESDHYSIVAEIETVGVLKNTLTNEIIYSMILSCNDLSMKLIINEKDLLGEPAPRRRFKGVVWIQGYLSLPD